MAAPDCSIASRPIDGGYEPTGPQPSGSAVFRHYGDKTGTIGDSFAVDRRRDLKSCSLENWRRRPDLNRGWRFCRFRQVVDVVDWPCPLVPDDGRFSLVFGRYLSRICLLCSIAIEFAKPVGHVRSHPSSSAITGTEAMDSGVAATRKSEGLTRYFSAVGVRRFSRAMVSLAVRPSSSAGAEPTWLDVPRNTGRRAMRGGVYTI